MKISKPLLIKVLGGSAAAVPAVGAGTYAIITHQEFEELNLKIRTLETQKAEQERTLKEREEKITDLESSPDSTARQKDKQDLEEAKRKTAEEEKKVQTLTEKLQKLEQEKEDADALKATVFAKTSEISRLKAELATANISLKSYRSTKSDPYATQKELIRQLTKFARDKNFRSGYDSYVPAAGMLYGLVNYSMTHFCQKQDGGLALTSSEDCKDSDKAMTLKELEAWSGVK